MPAEEATAESARPADGRPDARRQTHDDPPLHRRAARSGLGRSDAARPVALVFAALVVGAIFLALTGENPFSVYAQMVDACVRDSRGISETCSSRHPADPDRCCRCVAFKMLVWNIGAEGQFLLGPSLPPAWHLRWARDSRAHRLPVGHHGRWHRRCLLGLDFGGPAVYLGTNEIITTLMLNFIALNFMNYLIFGSSSPWRDPEVSHVPDGRPIPEASRSPSSSTVSTTGSSSPSLWPSWPGI